MFILKEFPSFKRILMKDKRFRPFPSYSYIEIRNNKNALYLHTILQIPFISQHQRIEIIFIQIPFSSNKPEKTEDSFFFFQN